MNTYDLPNYLPGNEPMYGVQQQAPQFFQGTDITVPVCLTDNYQVVDYNDYYVQAFLKADLSSPVVVWSANPNYGLSVVNGVPTINIPATITNQFPPGIYYLTVLGKAKANANHIVALFNQTISVVPSAASPIGNANYNLAGIQPGMPSTVECPAPDMYVPIDYFSI